MTTQQGEGTAAATLGDGAAQNQSSDTEVTELKTQIETLTATIAARDVTLAAATTSLEELQAANTKFADDAVGLATQAQQGKDAQEALEQSRKSTSELQVQLEQAATANSTLLSQMTSRRRQDLITRYGLPEASVANLDDAGLTVLESTLPHYAPASTPNTPIVPMDGNKLGLGASSGNGIDMSAMTEAERGLQLIERMKASK